jgi:RNA polymerase sigma factor (TIGR02999 family)
MRGILVDYARARQTDKRGGGCPTLSLSETDSPSPAPAVDILDLNSALEELEQFDEFQSRIVELRYFAGLSTIETAEVTGVSESTVKREWIVAKTWIRRRLLQENPQP